MNWFYCWTDNLKQNPKTFVAEHITIFARWNGQCPVCLLLYLEMKIVLLGGIGIA